MLALLTEPRLLSLRRPEETRWGAVLSWHPLIWSGLSSPHLQPHLTVCLFLPAVVVGREDLGPFMVNRSTGALWGWEGQIRRKPEMPLTSLLPPAPSLQGERLDQMT